MACSLVSSSSSERRRGFNLIEAAIVLGVVGIIIGGIWVATQSVLREQRINETIAGITYAIGKTRSLLPLSTYPTGVGNQIYPGGVLNAAGAYPPGWAANSNEAISPMGTKMEFVQACWTPCPMLSLSIANTGPRPISNAECVYIISRISALAKATNDLYYIQLLTPSTSTFISPPFALPDIVCPADFTKIIFWLNPAP